MSIVLHQIDRVPQPTVLQAKLQSETIGSHTKLVAFTEERMEEYDLFSTFLYVLINIMLAPHQLLYL